MNPTLCRQCAQPFGSTMVTRPSPSNPNVCWACDWSDGMTPEEAENYYVKSAGYHDDLREDRDETKATDGRNNHTE